MAGERHRPYRSSRWLKVSRSKRGCHLGQASGTRQTIVDNVGAGHNVGAGYMKIHSRINNILAAAAALALLVNQATAADLTLPSSDSTVGTITVNTPDSLTVSVGSSTTRILTNAITFGGGTLQGGVMDNVATVSGLTGTGTSSTFVDANGVTITLKGSGTANTTANLTLASGVTVTGASQLLVGGGAGGGISQSGNTAGDGGGGGGGNVVLTTGNLSGTLALTAGGGGDRAYAGVSAGLVGENTSIGATTALGGGASGYQNGVGGTSSKTINGATSNFTGGLKAGNTGAGGGAGSSSNGTNGAGFSGGAGGAGTQITTGVVGLSTYLGSDTFGGGGGGGGGTGTYSASNTGGAGGTGGGGAGNGFGDGVAGTNGFGGGGGGAGGGAGRLGGVGGAGSVAIQYAYDSNVAAGTLTLSGGITLNSTSTLDAVRSSGLIDVTTNGITGAGGLNIASSASAGGVVRLSVANTYTGATTVSGGTLVVNGSLASTAGLNVASGAFLGGSGSLASTIAGAGLVGPGNSPGILTAFAVDPSAGTDFSFELTGTGAPAWSVASASVNDVLHLTSASPFTSQLNSSNAVNIYFQVASLAAGDTFQGGFFTDATLAQSNLLSNVSAGSFNYFVQGNGSGSNPYNGVNYYTLEEYLGLVPSITGVTRSTQTVASANFATGTVTNGQVVELVIVPEPDTIIFAGIGIGMAAWSIWKRRRIAQIMQGM